jgi:uncharacterized protein YPO0396
MKTPESWVDELMTVPRAFQHIRIAEIQADARAELSRKTEQLEERVRKAEAAAAEMRSDLDFILNEIAECTTLNGLQRADVMEELVRRLPAFTSLSSDVGKGWLSPEHRKKMEAIQNRIPHTASCTSHVPPVQDANCDACRWDALKKEIGK